MLGLLFSLDLDVCPEPAMPLVVNPDRLIRSVDGNFLYVHVSHQDIYVAQTKASLDQVGYEKCADILLQAGEVLVEQDRDCCLKFPFKDIGFLGPYNVNYAKADILDYLLPYFFEHKLCCRRNAGDVDFV